MRFRLRRPDWRRLRAPVAVFLVALALGAGALAWHEWRAAQSPFPEVAQLSREHLSQQGYQDYFGALAAHKGALYAFDVLRRAPLPAWTSVHDIGHVIGAALYRQQGIAGLAYCTSEFRNACAHAVMIGLLVEQGPQALPQAESVCDAIPLPESRAMCYHGMGHGIISYENYDLPKSLALCARLGTPESRAYQECIGGVMMELVLPTHDKAAGASAGEKYLSAADPHAPCDASWYPAGARAMCYLELTPHFLLLSGNSLVRTDPDILARAFSYCRTLPAGSAERTGCDRGFGNWFVDLGLEYDFRRIGALGPSDMTRLRSWCALAGAPDDERECDRFVAWGLFWGGEVPIDQALFFCEAGTGALRQDCYAYLAQEIATNSPDARKAGLCARLPEQYRTACMPSS